MRTRFPRWTLFSTEDEDSGARQQDVDINVDESLHSDSPEQNHELPEDEDSGARQQDIGINVDEPQHSDSISSMSSSGYAFDIDCDASMESDNHQINSSDSSSAESAAGDLQSAIGQLREKFIKDTTIFKSLNIEEMYKEHPGKQILNTNFDADSFVFGTQEPSKFQMCHSITKIEFRNANPKVKPDKVRPSIKSLQQFRPSYPEGKIPLSPSSFDKFPSFTVATVSFNGGCTGYLSLHLLEEQELGTDCDCRVTNTWNAALNMALTRFNEVEVSFSLDGNVEAHYKSFLAPQTNQLKSDARNTMSFPGKFGTYHLMLAFEMLDIIAREEQNQSSVGADAASALLLRNKSVFVLQSAGFKKQWMEMAHTMEEKGPYWTQQEPPQFDPTNYSQFNSWLRKMTIDTHDKAEAFFINRDPCYGDGSITADASTFYAIDIAIRFSCALDNWDILPSGKNAVTVVQAATKMRRGDLASLVKSDFPSGSEEEEEEEEEDYRPLFRKRKGGRVVLQYEIVRTYEHQPRT